MVGRGQAVKLKGYCWVLLVQQEEIMKSKGDYVEAGTVFK